MKRSARAEHAKILRRAERSIDAAVLSAISDWLTSLRFQILHELGMSRRLESAAYPTAPFVVDQAVQAVWNEWADQLENQVLPTISIAFGEAFRSVRRADPNSSARPTQEYLAQVSDRLKIWPEGAFEDIRPELMEAIDNGESVDEIQDRIGRVLNIDAKSRRIRARINEIEERIADPEVDGPELGNLRAELRTLWRSHDTELNEWQWKARRIARTESHGAISAGMLASAKIWEGVTGVRLFKRWLSTEDSRTRATHRVADGQTVALDEPFRVGGFMLDHPADAITVAPHEVINCRCTMLIYDDDELQDELAGQDESGVAPGSVRMGPDDPDDADEAVETVVAEEHRAPVELGQRGEDHGQTIPPEPDDIELTDERDTLPMLDVTTATMEQLNTWLVKADETEHPDLYRAVEDELVRRYADSEVGIDMPLADLPDEMAQAAADLERALQSGDPDAINEAADRLNEIEDRHRRK